MLTAMSNEAEKSKEVTGATGNPGETSSESNKQQVELISRGIKASLEVFEPLSRASIDLFGQALNGFIQVLQKLSTAIASKK